MSLSQTLTRFYPLAGRIKANDSIDCNDDGAVFIEAQANVELSQILKDPDMDLFIQKLLLCDVNHTVWDQNHHHQIEQSQPFKLQFFSVGV